MMLTTDRIISAYFKTLAVFVVSTLAISPAARAEECLEFSNTAATTPGLKLVVENLSVALREAEICVNFLPYPLKRETIELIQGRLDGAAMRERSFGELVGDAAYMIPEPLGSTTGLLVSFDPELTSLETLEMKGIGIRLGAKWSSDILNERMNVSNAPSIKSLVAMLRHKRVAAILITDRTAKELEMELAGATVTRIVDLTRYTWIRSDLKHRAEEIAQAIRAYRAKGRTFFDPLPGKN